ncbi:acylamino-acid-releasing enzyme [Galdieria sulphuraria]|uniref:Acylamino-acid-releasing enzyme n=1 Tax=Galdieria sulphuraria TaxID=130081 RepID=M2XK95_GALSU|nr:acylamino-acid-releasing enzyme [Galdieria sulphuraria]EME30562.1 acylamino-acid-releasing enzyme [Galdieria sulphuraria]|eukprot:XP_005707082.1 acylamino-acid-releasing enzyme [Galdieria sulphuraria]
MTVLGATTTHPEDGNAILRIRDSLEVPWRELKYFPYSEEGDISADNEHVYLRSFLEAEKKQLVLAKRSNGAIVHTLAFSHQTNVGRVLLHPDDKRLQAVCFTFARKEWNFFDESMKEDFLFIEQKFGDVDLDFTSRDHADSIWVLPVIRDNNSVQYIMFDRRSRTTAHLFHERLELDEYILSKMEPVYGTAPFPLVLFVHGGPWARDYWGFNPMSQWFSNRGYACLQVNYCGSAGFGKSYLNNGPLATCRMIERRKESMLYKFGNEISRIKFQRDFSSICSSLVFISKLLFEYLSSSELFLL